MPYTRAQIIDSENPYGLLKNSDVLAEHRHILNELSAKEQEILAKKMITKCPQNELKDFGKSIQALYVPADKDTFHATISKALTVKTRILALLDPRNKSPHAFFLEESIEELLHNFHELCLQVLHTKETAIAERLALFTPDEKRNDVAKSINRFFRETPLPQRVGAAFNLKREINRLLLGPNPQMFFTSRDFNSEACRTYSSLFESLRGHEKDIGLRLSKVAADDREKIAHKLEELTSMAYDQANPFKLIKDAMENRSVPLIAHANAFFSVSKPELEREDEEELLTLLDDDDTDQSTHNNTL